VAASVMAGIRKPLQFRSFVDRSSIASQTAAHDWES
jgi:hypothetical protein